MVFTHSEKNPDSEFEVQFNKGSKPQFFDLETISLENNVKQPENIFDKIRAFYYVNVFKMDLGYMTKGIQYDRKTGNGPELMFVGNLSQKSNRYIMKNPQCVIGSDRLELYEFLAHRRESFLNKNKQLVKFMIGVTAVHAVLVQVPTLFSQYFGDEVSNAEKKLGASDKSEIGLKMSRMKIKRKEI